MSNISQKTMFFTTKRGNKRFQPLFGLIFAFISFFWLFSATSANAAIVWEGVDLGRVIDENFYNADFGRATDVYGNYWVITAPSFKTVYVLQKSGDTWSLAAKLTPSDSATVEGYGQSVAIHGNTIVVGTTQLGRQGAVYIYESAGAWSDMTETYKISGQPPVYTIMAGSVSYFNEWSDYFGYAVDVYNDTVVVGAHSSNINQGLVYVYQKPADGWASGTAVPVVLNPSATGFSETYAMFGRAVALNSNYLLATSLSYTGASGPHPAKGYLFAYSLPVTSSSVPMVLHSSDQNAYDGFGHSLDLTESGVAVVGATSASSGNGASGGAAYVFESPWNDGNVENAKLTGSTSRNGDSFGSSVSIVNDRILVGAPKNDIVYEFNPVYVQARPGQIGPNYSDDEQGAAYVFVKNNGSWQTGTEMFEITGPRNQWVYFGSQVEQLGDEMLVLPAGGFNNSVQQGLYSFNFSDYQNLKPQAEFVSQPVQANDSSGYVNASVLLTNTSNLSMKMAIDYSFDGISWYAADVWDLVTSSVGSLHSYGPSEVTDITETAGGNLVSFSWDTRFSNSRNQYFDDSAFADNNFYLRVRYGIDRVSMAEPYLYTGAGLVSDQFHVQNDLTLLQSPGPITLTAATSSMLVSWPRFYGAGYFVSSTASAEPVIVPALTTTTFNNLLTNTQYSFQVASYGGSTGALTPYSAVFSAYTAANLPAGLAAVVNGQTKITLNWSGDATEYYADNVTTSSSWIATTTYAFSDLACATDYNFSVKGRNSDGLETAAVTTTARTFDCDGSVSTAGNNTTTTPPSGDSGNTGSSNGGSSVVIPTVVTSTLAEVSPVSTTTIHVNSDVVNATQMILSEDPNFIGASWIDYTTSTAFILSDGNGEKTVYVKYRSASGGVSDTRSFMLVLANLGGQNSPGDNGQNTTSTLTSSTIQNTPTSTGSTGNTNSSSTNIGNTGSRSTSTSTAGARPVTARPLAAVSGVKIVAPTSSSANIESLEIKLSTTSADNGLIPTAQAAENRGFGSKARGYFTRIFSPKNNRLIALSVIVAIVIIGSGWFYHKPKKDDKTDTNPETTPDKEGQNDKDDKLS